MTMITPSYLGETIEYSSLHACRSTLEDPTRKQPRNTLALPFKPLCSPTCQGLCPKCGTDLNHGPCRCGDNGGGGPFDVLKSLKLK